MATAVQIKQFYCLRCQHRFDGELVPRQVVERTCPLCASNSVRQETPRRPLATRRVRWRKAVLHDQSQS